MRLIDLIDGRRDPGAWGAERTGRLLRVLGLALFAVVLVRTAWVCDDAFITFRVIDNFLHGFGLRWNIAERVQVYTHPGWMLALIPPSLLVGPYYASIALGGLLSVGVVGWLSGVPGSGNPLRLGAIAAAIGAQGFVDFSTGGLENPLAHVLLLGCAGAAVAAASRPSPAARTAVVALAAAACVNRLDHVLLVAPLVLSVARRGSAREWARALAIGGAPLWLWEAFALIYYGSLLPNTAYAKLATGIPPVALARQGAVWLETCTAWDPVLVFVLGSGVVAAVVWPGPTRRAAVVGIALYLAYLVRIGGDHMVGRCLTAPFVLALWLVVSSPIRPLLGGLWTLAVLPLAALAHHPPIATGIDLLDNQLGPDEIADERAYFYRISGLLRRPIDGPIAGMPGAFEGADQRRLGRHTVVREMIGWYGYYAGPEVHVIDTLGLGDPLLARAPASSLAYRAGHYRRTLPAGYREAAHDGLPLDGPLDGAWHDVLLATRAPLLSLDRWGAILRLARPWADPRITEWCAASCSVFDERRLVGLEPPMWVPPLGIGDHPKPRRRIEGVAITGDPGRYLVRLSLRGRPVAAAALEVGETGGGAVDFPPTGADQVRVLTDPPGEDRRIRSIELHPP